MFIEFRIQTTVTGKLFEIFEVVLKAFYKHKKESVIFLVEDKNTVTMLYIGITLRCNIIAL